MHGVPLTPLAMPPSATGGIARLAAARVLVVAVGPAPDEARLAEAAAIPGLEHRILDGRLEWMEGGRDWLVALFSALSCTRPA